MLDWNDIRSFIAVAETGSTLAGGRALRVSQTTVARRVAALEAALSVVLFDKRPAGYLLTPAGEALLTRAQAVKTAAEDFFDAGAAQSRAASGTVRLTTHDIYAATILVRILQDLHEAYPAIRVELDTSEEVRDLALGSADIALRSTTKPHGSGLVGRRVGYDDWTIFCSRSYAAEHGLPRTTSDLRNHPLIGGGGEGVWRPYLEWLKRNDLDDAVVMQHGSAGGLLAAVRAGVGLAVLPCFVADHDVDLLRCLAPPQHKSRELWLLTHQRLRHEPRIRIVLDFVGERLIRLTKAVPYSNLS